MIIFNMRFVPERGIDVELESAFLTSKIPMQVLSFSTRSGFTSPVFRYEMKVINSLLLVRSYRILYNHIISKDLCLHSWER